MAKTEIKTENKQPEFNPEAFAMIAKMQEERKKLLDELCSVDIGEYEEYLTPLKRKERKKFEKLINEAKDSDDVLEDLAAAILAERGLSEEKIDDTEIDTLIIFGKRLLLSSADLEHIAKKK